VRGGAEAAAHAARRYVGGISGNEVLVKLDFKNAFNTCRRDTILEAVFLHAPELFPFVSLCYGSSTVLTFGTHIISSQEGIQQGDPLGPMLFCLAVHGVVQSLTSDVVIAYLDDVTLGGRADRVLVDVSTFQREAAQLGLSLNPAKSEVIEARGRCDSNS